LVAAVTGLGSVCVFCGSNPGARPEYAEAARLLGERIAGRGLRLVYGGGGIGLMGVVTDAALAAGGEVVGVIPQHLVDRELAHPGVTDLRITGSMHERKALMADLAGGFVALPGGLGTLEELFEILTWSQLGLQSKPCGLLDVAGFFEPLLAFLDHTVAERFVSAEHRQLVLADRDPDELLDKLEAWQPRPSTKWLDR
jgi:uncharacterized protein (TIGR00730 family)